MDVILDFAFVLPVLFFIIAFAYSSVGLGGGSSYTALMLIIGMNTLSIPLVTLSLNLFVTTIGSFNFIRNKHAKLKLLLPFIITSIPLAYLGGALKLPGDIFYFILGMTPGEDGKFKFEVRYTYKKGEEEVVKFEPKVENVPAPIVSVPLGLLFEGKKLEPGEYFLEISIKDQNGKKEGTGRIRFITK